MESLGAALFLILLSIVSTSVTHTQSHRHVYPSSVGKLRESLKKRAFLRRRRTIRERQQFNQDYTLSKGFLYFFKKKYKYKRKEEDGVVHRKRGRGMAARRVRVCVRPAPCPTSHLPFQPEYLLVEKARWYILYVASFSLDYLFLSSYFCRVIHRAPVSSHLPSSFLFKGTEPFFFFLSLFSFFSSFFRCSC